MGVCLQSEQQVQRLSTPCHPIQVSQAIGQMARLFQRILWDKNSEVKDAPACLLPNGRVLCVAGPVDGLEKSYLTPTYFFEFDPTSLNLVPITNPPNNGSAPFSGRMLLLPTGQVLFANGSYDIEVYTPDGEPNGGMEADNHQLSNNRVTWQHIRY